MKFICSILVVFLTGCGTLSRFNYDGGGKLGNLMSCRNDVCAYKDTLDDNGFNSIILFHVKLHDRSVKPDPFGSQIAMFRLTDKYLSSTPELREALYWRGDFARFYHQRIFGDWVRGNDVNTLDSCAILGVKSEIGEVTLTKIRLQIFAASAWLDVPLNKTFHITPGYINYLGTLTIEVEKTTETSGRTIKQAYFKYDTAIVEGNTYKTTKNLSIDTSDFERDKEFLFLKYPSLSRDFGSKFQFIR